MWCKMKKIKKYVLEQKVCILKNFLNNFLIAFKDTVNLVNKIPFSRNLKILQLCKFEGTKTRHFPVLYIAIIISFPIFLPSFLFILFCSSFFHVLILSLFLCASNPLSSKSRSNYYSLFLHCLFLLLLKLY